MIKNLFTGLLALGLLAGCSTGQELEIQPAPLSAVSSLSETPAVEKIFRFGKVNDNLYRGGLPTDADLAELKKFGVKSILSFRGLGDPTEAVQIAQEKEVTRSLGMKFFNVQIPFDTPVTDKQAADFFKIVENPKNQPVFVHCKGGRDRTGTMVALYRIKNEGFTNREALEEMTKFTFVPNDYPLFSQLVLNYKPGKPLPVPRVIVKNSRVMNRE